MQERGYGDDDQGRLSKAAASMASRYAASMASLLLLLLLLMISSGAALQQLEERRISGRADEADSTATATTTSSYTNRRLHFRKYRDPHQPASASHEKYIKLPTATATSTPTPTTSRRSFVLAVEGVVHCQHCKHVGTNSLLEATRLPGAKVRLACRNELYKTFVYKTTYTNAHGYFNIPVENYNFRLHGGVQSCIVYLVSSPSQSCYKTTNINSGRIGAPLTRQKVYPNVILYSVGPFAFAPTSCNVPSSYFKLPKAHYRFSSSSW